jgi:Haem-binding domain
MIKKIMYGLLAALVVIQFFRPAKNNSGDQFYDISKKYEVPDDVATILKNACNDCHTNTTQYPWYANIQPVAWWLAGHVNDGKRHLNFSEYTARKVAVQNHKFEEIAEMVEEKEMPLASYTWFNLHPGSDLSDAERHTLINWAKAQMDTLKAHYPADSLILKRPPPPPAK